MDSIKVLKIIADSFENMANEIKTNSLSAHPISTDHLIDLLLKQAVLIRNEAIYHHPNS